MKSLDRAVFDAHLPSGSIVEAVLGSAHTVDPKLVRAFVRHLRGKLGDDDAQPVYVLAARGVGYRRRGNDWILGRSG